MGTPREWREELLSEWLQIQGYLVETNVPLGSTRTHNAETDKRAGGRLEADVVGVRIKDGRLEIRHIETGQLLRNVDKNLETINKKFGSSKEVLVERYKNILGTDLRYVYYKEYTTGDKSEELLNMLNSRLRESGIRVTSFDREILPEILRDVSGKVFTPRGHRTLPSNLWLLRMIEHLIAHKFLSVP